MSWVSDLKTSCSRPEDATEKLFCKKCPPGEGFYVGHVATTTTEVAFTGRNCGHHL